MERIKTDMNALVWDGCQLKLCKKEQPEIRKGNQVKVRMYASGICGTDLNIIKKKSRWHLNRIIGHEGVGTVVEIGEDVTNCQIGDRVIIDPTQYCGKCNYCRVGLTNFCVEFDKIEVGRAVDGLFAEYYVGEETFIYKIPSDMDWETAVLTEPLACVLHNVDECNIESHHRVLIIGGGPIGALCALIAAKKAKSCVVIENSIYRNQFLIDCEIHTVNNISELNNSADCSREKFDIIIDTVGNQLEIALDLIGKGGKIAIMGIDNGFNMLISPSKLLASAVSIVTFGEYHNYFQKAFSILNIDKKFKKLVTGQFKIDKFKDAFSSVIGFDLTTEQPRSISSMKTILLL